MENPEARSDARDAGERPSAFGGVASKIVLLVFVATFLTATGVSWVSIQSSGASLRGMIDRLYPLSLEHAARRIDPWIRAAQLELERLAHHPTGELAGEPTTQLDGLVIFDADGRAEESWGVVPETAADALASPHGIAAVELPDGHFGLAIAPHRGTGDRRVVGILSLQRVVSMFEVELPTEHALIALVDREGRVLAKAGPAPGGRPLSHLALDGLRSRGQLRETVLAGVHVIGAAQPIDLLEWQVAIVTPFDAAYGSVLTAVARIFAIDLGIILAFSLVAYRVAAHVMRPIGRLSEAVKRSAEGESNLAIPVVESRDEIGVLSRTFGRMLRQQRAQREEIEEANRHLLDRNFRLEQANEVLNQLSITDGLTKLHNHRYFQDHLTREIRRVERSRESLAILLLDIDDFKSLNDRLGHAAGDEILVRIAQILVDAIRGSDLCARYGGEEFVILAPNTDAQGAYELAEKVRTEIAESSFIVDDSMRPLRATVSVGVAAFEGNRLRFFQQADQALYRAKAAGKNCVVVHGEGLHR